MNLSVCLSLALLTCLPCAWGATSVDAGIFPAGTNGVRTSWNAIPGRVYLFQTTTNLSALWRDALTPPGSLTAVTNFLSQTFATNALARFFRVLKVDTVGPEVYRVEPLAGAIAVGRQAALRAWIRDESGIATNSLKLTITNRPPVVFGDPQLHFANGLLTYTPGPDEFLAVAGNIVTVSLDATDILGNQTTNFNWSFQLELPVVPATNMVFIGGGGSRQTPSTLTLLSTNGNNFTYAYTGTSSGLANGQFLVSTNLATGYTRTVVSFSENTVNRTVAVLTRPAKLAELLQQGTFSSATLTEIKSASPGPATQGNQAATVSTTGLGFDFNFDLTQTVFQDGALTVELMPGSFMNLNGKLDLALNIKDSRVREFEAKFSSTADFRLEARVNASGALDRTPPIKALMTVHRLYGGFIGVVPVWVELVYEINVGCDLHLEAQASYTQGLSGTKAILLGRRWNSTAGWSTPVEYPPAEFTVVGPAWQAETTGNLRVYLQPKVTAHISSTAAISLGVQPYTELNGRAQVHPGEWELALYGGLSSTLGLDLRAWDEAWGELQSATLDLIPRTLLWYTNSLASVPRITQQPKYQSVRLNDTAILSVEAIGETPLSYLWLKHGLVLRDDFLISGSRTPFLRVRNVQPYDDGEYQVEISNSKGSKMSDPARVLVYGDTAPPGIALVPPGMVRIPGGTFIMGSPVTEKERSSAETQHTVTLTNDFYMTKYEVTQREYLAVMGNNPSFFTGDLNRPVEQVSWNDATNYCGKLMALERAAGRLPAGWMYRLPTEAEWEYACRAGTSTPFHFGSDLRSGMANFSGVSEYVSGTGTVTNSTGFVLGRTTAVGSYQPNSFGLYDMHGNVWEWCSDTYGTDTSSYRVFRGGGWFDSARDCRSAEHTLIFPWVRGSISVGFRPVLAPGQ